MPIRRRGELGKIFSSGEVIVQQGDVGEEMYVVQAGKVEVVLESGGRHERVAVLGPRDFFGEMALLSEGQRTATVSAVSLDLENVLNHADEALYKAKHSGRNAVCCADISASA